MEDWGSWESVLAGARRWGREKWMEYGRDLLWRLLDSVELYCSAHRLLDYQECLSTLLPKGLAGLVRELASRERYAEYTRVTPLDAELVHRMPRDIYRKLDAELFSRLSREIGEAYY